MIASRRAAAAALVLGLALAGAAAAQARPLDEPGPAQPPGGPVRVPEALLLEVVTAPGYDWMAACLQAGGAGSTAGAIPPAGAGRAADGGHSAHHPQPAATVPPLGGGEADKARTALQGLLDAVERMRAGL